MTTLVDILNWKTDLENVIGDGAQVSVRTQYYGEGLMLQVDWPNDFHCRISISKEEIFLRSDILERFQEYIVQFFVRRYAYEIKRRENNDTLPNTLTTTHDEPLYGLGGVGTGDGWLQ